MNSAIALLEATEDATKLPRHLSILEATCDLFWRGAGPFCYYCKEAGHWVTACKRLEKRKQRNALKDTSASLSSPLQTLSTHTPIPFSSPLFTLPEEQVQNQGISLKRSVGTRPTASPPEHSFIAEEIPPLERRQKKKAKGKQKQEIQRMPSPLLVLESRENSPSASPMNASPNPSDDEVMLAPVASPTPFGPPLPPGFERLDQVITPPLPLSPSILPATPSQRQLHPLLWREATPPGTSYDSTSAVDIELERRLARVYTVDEVEAMRKEIEEEKYQQYLDSFN